MAQTCHYVAAADVGKVSTGQTQGMTRKSAIVGISDRICSSVMYAEPNSNSAIHHHGEQDTIVYCASGNGGAVVFDGGRTKQVLNEGDFCLIPAHVLHQETKQGNELIKWIIHRTGRDPCVVNVDSWNDQP